MAEKSGEIHCNCCQIQLTTVMFLCVVIIISELHKIGGFDIV